MNQAEKFQQLTCTHAIRNDLRGKSVRAATYTWATGMGDFVLRIGSTAILARLVLPAEFGLVMMVMAVTAIADQFRDLGLSSATVQRKDISHEEVSNLFWVNFMAGVVIALIVCAISPLVSLYYKESRLTVLTCVLAMNFIWSGLMVQHQSLLTRQLKLGYTSGIRLASSFLSTLLAVFLAWKGMGCWALVWREVVRSACDALRGNVVLSAVDSGVAQLEDGYQKPRWLRRPFIGGKYISHGQFQRGPFFPGKILGSGIGRHLSASLSTAGYSDGTTVKPALPSHPTWIVPVAGG